MSVELEGIVLATSRKLNGYCVVILETSSLKFYRIISDSPFRNGGELSETEITTADGKRIENLDVVKLYVKSKNPVNDMYQHENIILDDTKKFIYLNHIDKNDLVQIFGDKNLNFPTQIFINEWSSMTATEARNCVTSFMLLKVFGLKFYVEQNSKGEPSCKCSFKYNGIEYTGMNVTISATKEDDIRKYAGKHYPNGLVCFSFGAPYLTQGNKEPKCFKFMCSFLGYWSYYGK